MLIKVSKLLTRNIVLIQSWTVFLLLFQSLMCSRCTCE